jgi:hypothetical protein
VPISALDTITLAFEHTKRQLVQPFRFGQWTRLAAVGLLAGELSSGGCNITRGLKIPQHPGASGRFEVPDLSGLGIDVAALVGLIAILVLTALVFGIVMIYVGSVMRFILFDSILTKECHILEGWNRRQGPGWRYFLWKLGFAIAFLAAGVMLLGIPAAIGFAAGWFDQPREHVPELAVGGSIVFVLFVVFAISAAVILVLTKDFVVPQMALEGIGAVEGWRRLWPMMQAEKGDYAAYVGMKIVLSILAGIIIAIASLTVVLLVAIPTAVLAIVAVITGKTAGLTWNVSTITVAVVVGCIVLAVFLYLISLITVPAIVFFPAYSIYFFAGRYQALSLALYPPPAVLPSGVAPSGEPPLSPAPAG